MQHYYILLRARRERPRRRTTEQRDELASSWIEHGLLPGPRYASLPQGQDARKRPQVLGVDLNRSESREKGQWVPKQTNEQFGAT